MSVIKRLVENEGLLNLYRGVTFEILRGVTSSATMFMLAEKLRGRIEGLVKGGKV